MDKYPLVALEQNVLCPMPVAILLCAFKICAVMAVEILEDPVLVLEAAMYTLGSAFLDGGHASALRSNGAGWEATRHSRRGQGAGSALQRLCRPSWTRKHICSAGVRMALRNWVVVEASMGPRRRDVGGARVQRTRRCHRRMRIALL